MFQSCYYRLACFCHAFFFSYQSRYETTTCANIWAALCFCIICTFKTCRRCTWARVCVLRSKNKPYESFWCLVRHCLAPRVLSMKSAGGQPFLIPSHRCPSSLLSILQPAPAVMESFLCFFFFWFFFLNQSIGAKPDESPGDPAARVLTLH